MPRLTAILLFVLGPAAIVSADDWTSWRGPHGDGICDETDLPKTWSATENVAWKVPLPAPGNSTPIVLGEKIFLTSATASGDRRSLLCLDRTDGRLLWQRDIEYLGQEPTHETNPFCSASPATDGERVVVWHGSAGAAAYDLDGTELWRRTLGEFQHIWGNAASPVFHGDLVILHCGPGLNAFLIALDKRTGDTVWQRGLTPSTELEQYFGSWSTPRFRTADDGIEMLVSHPGEVVAYNPLDGTPRWKCRGLTDLVYTSPLIGDNAVVAMSGYGGAALAVRTGGADDVTDTHRLWVTEKNHQRIGSGLIVAEHIYMQEEPGIARCLKLATGEPAWEERLGANSWSSLVLADGLIYALNMAGETYLFKPEPTRFELVGMNALDGETTRASPALSDGQILIRGYGHLYCIGDRK